MPQSYSLSLIPSQSSTFHEKNRQADALANLASTLAVSDREIKVPICQQMVISSTLEVKNEDEVNVVSIYEVDKDD